MITNWSGVVDRYLPCIVLMKIPLIWHSALKQCNVLPGLLAVSSCVGKHMCSCAWLPFFAPENLSLCCFGCGCARVFGTEHDKCGHKGMGLWMMNCDTGEGKKRWTPLGEELSSCLSRSRRFLESFTSNWKHFVFATAWFLEHSVFYSCHLPKYTVIDFNLHSVRSGYLEHLQSQDIEWLFSKVTCFSSLWFAALHYVSVIFSGHRPEV